MLITYQIPLNVPYHKVEKIINTLTDYALNIHTNLDTPFKKTLKIELPDNTTLNDLFQLGTLVGSIETAP